MDPQLNTYQILSKNQIIKGGSKREKLREYGLWFAVEKKKTRRKEEAKEWWTSELNGGRSHDE